MTNRIDNSVVVFTSASTAININANLTTQNLGQSLKVQITPTRDGQNIHSIKISYSDHLSGQHFAEEIKDESLFQMITLSMKGEGESLYDRIMDHVASLADGEIAVIEKEYSKYGHISIANGFVAGVSTYIAFLLLQEQNVFALDMPFQFSMPVTVASANIVNHNMFHHLSLPLTALANLVKGLQLQMVSFVQSFINIWDPAFLPGPNIGSAIEARLCMDVISGISQYTTLMLAKVRDEAVEQIACEARKIACVQQHELKEYIDNSLQAMKSEIASLVSGAITDNKKTIDVLTHSVQNHMNVDVSTNKRNFRVPRQRTFA